jgi:competence protein ComEA
VSQTLPPWHAIEPASTGTPGETDGLGSPAPGDPGKSWVAALSLVGALVAGGLAVALVVSGPTPLAAVIAPSTSPATQTASSDAALELATPAPLVVHVAGGVTHPGLVTLPEGSRVADAIEAAGGLDPRADPALIGAQLNLAERLTDGERIVVPVRGDAPVSTGDAATGDAAGGGAGEPVDLNHASAEALDTLPGIGPVTAAKIIKARAEQPFRTLDELVSRKVLGQATLEKIRSLAVVR